MVKTVCDLFLGEILTKIDDRIVELASAVLTISAGLMIVNLCSLSSSEVSEVSSITFSTDLKISVSMEFS